MAAGCSSRSPAGPTGPSESPAPVITTQPQDQTVAAGASATLTVAASSPLALTYQWYQGTTGEMSSPVAGAVAASFITPPLTSAARYWVRVSGGDQAVDSTTATVTIAAALPTIVEQPESETIAPGESARLVVEVAGTGPMAYQWHRVPPSDGADPIEGATSATYTTPALSETTRYFVRVSNPAGFIDSTTVTIAVATSPPPDPPKPPPPGPPAPPAPGPPAPPPPAPPPPTPLPPDPGAAAFEDAVLVLVNQRRAAGAVCGGTSYAPAPPLVMHGSLRAAARGHSQDMATLNFFAHTSLDGRTFLQRIQNAGYAGSGPYGENIGAGYGSAAAVVAGWMGSTGHCQNIMNGSFRSAGVGYAFGAATTYGSYWTINFAGS